LLKNSFKASLETTVCGRGGVTESEHRKGLLLYASYHICLNANKKTLLACEVKEMVIGEKLWEGKGKSGRGFIKSVGMEGVTSVYTWTAQMKGMGKAKGMDGNLNVTGLSMMPPKGLATAKNQGMFMTMTGDMAVLKGFDLTKDDGQKPTSVGLWKFMTMSEKLAWLNNTITLVTFEALDPMWTELNVTIWEWK
jgi:hypothetical protein